MIIVEMNEITEALNGENRVEKPGDATPTPQDVVHNGGAARAINGSERRSVSAEVPAKKRKTRRGKSKRKAPYQKYGTKHGKAVKRIVKPEAPHNDNQFLLEDHGGFEKLDERLKNIDQASTSSVTRTRDSSFSVDSDGGEEFYSSPEDEDEFLMQDFNDQYQSVQTEQLQKMSKQELIDEYLALDNRSTQKYKDLEESIARLQKELDRQNSENETLQKENELLKSKLQNMHKGDSDSEDSETDSSDSCSSSSSVSSSGSSRGGSPLPNGENGVEYHQHTNGHVSPLPAV